MKKVLFVSNIPSPYNVDYLNALGKRRPVTAVFERGHASNRDGSWKQLNVQDFSCHILKGISKGRDAALSPGVLRYIHRHRKDHIIIGNPATPTGILAILYCKLFCIPFILQSEGGMAGSGRGMKEKIKYFLMHDACMYLSGMSLKNEYFLTYGATPDRVKQYPFTSMFQKDLAQHVPTAGEKAQLRRELGIEASRVVLYVGRFLPGKGVDTLLRACADLPEDTAMVAVGGQPTQEYQALQQQLNLSNVYYVGHADKETVKKYYLAADIFVLPTRGDTWGLVINEAMAAGLPVITTKACVAGLELITDNENGYLIDVDDWKSLHEKLRFLLENNALCRQMGSESLKRIQPYTMENMAATIDAALSGLEK